MKSYLSSIILFVLLGTVRVLACDICGCAIPNHPWEPRRGLYLGVTEQFTGFNTIQVNGGEIDNGADQYLDSSNTQLFAGYNFTSRVGLQFNVPLIHRSFRRTAGDEIETGVESGVGDVALLGSVIPFYRNDANTTFMMKLIGGVKFPTGNSDRLREEAEEGHTHGEAEPIETHDHGGVEEEHEGGEGTHEHEHNEEAALPASAVHGHDLALGSGSVDGVIGASLYARFKRVFISGEVQYSIRSEGDHDYRYANDLTWSGGPGVYLKDDPDLTFAVQLICSGESKQKDEFRGELAEDTALTAVYLGPKFSGTFRDRIAAEVEIDIPVLIDNSALQIVPDYRVRAGISVRF
jgi:hypothetical protein